MNTYIALFRGINVGGKSVLPMHELINIIENLGAQKVRTYIQSGNVVFLSDDFNVAQLANTISSEVERRCGFAPFVLVLGTVDIEKAIAGNPFPEAETDPSNLHLGFLGFTPKKPNIEMLESLKKASERFQLIENVFYLYAPDGVGRSKLAINSEKLLGVPMTDRNWNTVRKIREMATE
jgi:uncharacterized protein (DUF1697 family)